MYWYKLHSHFTIFYYGINLNSALAEMKKIDRKKYPYLKIDVIR